MTRREFIEDMEDWDWSDLINFCWQHDCYECENIFTEEDKDDWIDEGLVSRARGCSTWRELLQELYDIPTDCCSGYYRLDEYGTFIELDDDDFEEYKNNVIDWADDNGILDDEEDDEDSEEELVTEDLSDETELEIDEGCTLGTLFTCCSESFEEFKKQENNRENNNIESKEEIEEEENVLDFFYA